MKKAIAFCLLFASFALAQRQSIAVLDPEDPEPRLTAQQRKDLTGQVRELITKKLPDFSLMKQDEVQEILGDTTYSRKCQENACLGSFIDSLGVNFGARCDIYTVNEQLRLKFELYGKPKDENKARTIGEFTENVKNFADIQAVVRKQHTS